jgi:hypothetical protein
MKGLGEISVVLLFIIAVYALYIENASMVAFAWGVIILIRLNFMDSNTNKK